MEIRAMNMTYWTISAAVRCISRRRPAMSCATVDSQSDGTVSPFRTGMMILCLAINAHSFFSDKYDVLMPPPFERTSVPIFFFQRPVRSMMLFCMLIYIAYVNVHALWDGTGRPLGLVLCIV